MHEVIVRDNTIKFFDSSEYFICPVCRNELFLQGNSLCCSGGHCFDISKHGYVNLSPKIRQSKKYNKETFVGRNQVLNSGYYSHILKDILEILGDIEPSGAILDAGCGEGYYSKAVWHEFHNTVLAFDLSKHSIELAAKKDMDNAVKWFVGDLADVPVKEHCVDVVLNVFSPANYKEFCRVLRKGGYIIKVVPGKNHLKELRHIAQDSLKSKEYSNDRVIDYFEKHFPIITQKRSCATYGLSTDEVKIFADMTPLLFNVDKDSLKLDEVDSLTIEAEIIVGKL